jgi:hypothetical protein
MLLMLQVLMLREIFPTARRKMLEDALSQASGAVDEVRIHSLAAQVFSWKLLHAKARLLFFTCTYMNMAHSADADSQ